MTELDGSCCCLIFLAGAGFGSSSAAGLFSAVAAAAGSSNISESITDSILFFESTKSESDFRFVKVPIEFRLSTEFVVHEHSRNSSRVNLPTQKSN